MLTKPIWETLKGLSLFNLTIPMKAICGLNLMLWLRHNRNRALKFNHVKNKELIMRIRLRSRTGIALFVFIATIAFFLITEHLAHLIPVLPWLFLLLCPLMHLFMHGSHRAV